MKLKIYYENISQVLEVDTNEMWSCLGFEKGLKLPMEEKEKIIQDKVNKEWNHDDFNNWKKYRNHLYVPQKDEVADDEDFVNKIPTSDSFESLLIAIEEETTRKKIREILGKHKEWADIVIAVVFDGYSIPEYAKKIGKSRTNVNHMYNRALKLLKTFYEKSHKTPHPNVDI